MASMAIDPKPFPTEDHRLVDTISTQEQTLRFTRFDSDIAFSVGTLIRERFKTAEKTTFKGRGIVISISLFTGHTLFSCAVGEEGEVGPNNWLWVEAKKNVVRRFSHSSFYLGRKIAAEGKTPESMGLVFPEYACHGGAFPIWLKSSPGAPIGVIVVSGLAQKDDHQLIVDVLTAFLPSLV